MPHHNLFQFASCNQSSHFSFIVAMPQLSKPSQNTLAISNHDPRFRWKFTWCNTWSLQIFLINMFQIIFIQFMDTFYFCLIHRVWKLFVKSFYFWTYWLKILYVHSCLWPNFAFTVSFIFVTYFTIIFFGIICC